jgi:DNA invertase Pin-like site-specific DNA recombinase
LTGASVTDLCAIVGRIERKGAALRILAMNLDTASLTGKLMLNVLGSVAQSNARSCWSVSVRDRQSQGRGKYKGERRLLAPSLPTCTGWRLMA